MPWYTFRGGPGDEGINGVAAWNEFRGQVAVVGWKQVGGPNYDIDVGSYYTSESYGGSPNWAMRPLTAAQVGGEGWEAPAVNGQSEVTRGVDSDTRFEDFGLGGPSNYPLGNPASPRGGGISQDQTGRVHIVGATRSPQGAGSYPVVGGGGIVKQADLQDAVRTALDLLPATMARTDGTGPLPLGTIAGDGGTTPPCALLPFGNRVGSTPPPLQRMLINYDGTVPQLGAGGLGNFVVTRPPSDLLGVAAFLRLGFPGYVLPGLPGGSTNPFQPIVLPDGVEFWTPDELYVVTYGPVSNAVWTSPPVPFPTSSITVTVQAFFMVTNAIPAGNPSAAGLPCPSGTTTFCATPAIVVSY